jgi:hypothetical protein
MPGFRKFERDFFGEASLSTSSRKLTDLRNEGLWQKMFERGPYCLKKNIKNFEGGI